MSDCHNNTFTPSGDWLADIQNAVNIIRPYTNLATLNSYAAKGEGRSSADVGDSGMSLIVDSVSVYIKYADIGHVHSTSARISFANGSVKALLS